MKRIHIRFGQRRTTISIDDYLFDILAIKINAETGDEHSTIKEWLQTRLVDQLGESSGRNNATYYARKIIITEIMDKELSTLYMDKIISST